MSNIAQVPAALKSENFLNQLAIDLVAKLEPVDQVCEKHGITQDELKLHLIHPSFAQRIADAKKLWFSPSNVSERIKIKAGMALEDMLPTLVTIAADGSIAAPARVDALRQLAKFAGVDAPENAGGGGGPGFSITINLGEQAGPKVIEGEATRVAAE